ncbi:hypothetical protein [Candidatus Blastococcus massiliensis]|uniref:hypothetical protein n=1 Tax=Candidatus Blastococcus massiliensis TaxID=1470358 RepID=UPI0004B5639B|nr:hypothetical protein [Candidatus Blastococcus massiliensis]
MRFRPAGLLPVLLLSALVACGGDEPQDDPEPTATAATTSEESPPTSSPSPPDGSPGGASPGQVPRPSPGSCQPVAESPDGRYVIPDVGEIELRLEGPGELTLNVRSSGEWSTSVDSDDDEAEIEFTRGDEEIDFEADVEGGRLVLRICDGDGD